MSESLLREAKLNNERILLSDMKATMLQNPSYMRLMNSLVDTTFYQFQVWKEEQK